MSRTLRRLGGAALLVVALGAAPAVASADNYVALGDSYSSGVGTNSYTLSSSCLRSVYAYPYLLSQQRPNTSLNFVACSGATTTDVMNNQISAVTSSTNLASISIGGNDLGFSGIIVNCTLLDCNAQLASTKASADATLTPKLDTVYAAIKSRAPGATVAVLGYPRLFSTSGCLGTSGISSSERSNANLLSDEIDRITAREAASYGFTYKSATSAFTGHAVCSSSAWLNGLNIFNSTESYHPNRSGHSSGYLPLVRQVLG